MASYVRVITETVVLLRAAQNSLESYRRELWGKYNSINLNLTGKEPM
jgi:hypothetical protein